ncbi:hypothetical protein Ana3638_23075 [Anaerocolumna sedimenticola]|uniref:Uncharacterized protein n=1 Tax=Anaerocolumna sedimenticola TaxID=2696063 RepID=A0A6P1TPX9_9FIRM|nr:hypothetical protein [Anaerocolumna sedimenticola]QHQ63300.1 hypothetical protein Ana3638_23075 [Anaerocolumna sedimenticola]
MKGKILFTLSLGILCGLIYVTKITPDGNNKDMHLKVDYTATSLEDLTNNSSIVVEATVNNEQEEIDYSGITFTLSEIKINNIIKGDNLLKNDTVLLLQTNSYEDPVVEKGSKKILFLNKYEGPIVENAYVCTGLYQGNFTVNEDNTISTSTKYSNNITNVFVNKSKDELEKSIKKINKN